MTLNMRDDYLEQLAHEGYCIVENVLSPEHADEIAEEILELEEELEIEPHGNSFEGARTTRIYNLLTQGPTFWSIATNPQILPIVEAVLDPGLLVSSISSINIRPGERTQPLHTDDAVIGIPRPHPALICNTMWALTDFTEENGATRIIPGSHKRDHGPDYGAEYDSVPAVMEKGSVLIWNGSLWHGGGANTTNEEARVGVAMNYCAGFIRQQENQQLGLDLELVRSFPHRLQEMCGFAPYKGLIGHIDRTSPMSLLGEGEDFETIWDRVG